MTRHELPLAHDSLPPPTAHIPRVGGLSDPAMLAQLAGPGGFRDLP